MREIKFRAWDKSAKKLELPTPHNYWLLISVNGSIYEFSLGKLYKADKIYELMQYTGIKDINNKEIYEGDIVEVKYSDGSGYDFPVEVTFEKGSFWVGAGYLNNVKIIKVVGNIYENPELLEAKL